MTVQFRITTAPCATLPTAVATDSQVMALRHFLRREASRLSTAMLIPDGQSGDDVESRFEARVCPFALASIASLFNNDPDIIGVLEEAQFRGRRIAVTRRSDSRTYLMETAATSDLGLALDLTEDERSGRCQDGHYRGGIFSHSRPILPGGGARLKDRRSPQFCRRRRCATLHGDTDKIGTPVARCAVAGDAGDP